MKALILTGGPGRRLVPFSATRPKGMTVVAGGSLIRRTLNFLRETGVTDATIVLGQHGETVRRTFDDGETLGVQITYAQQTRPSGIADAILQARDRFIPREYFILVYGDVVTAGNPFHPLLQSFNAVKGPVASVCLPGPPTGRYGNVYLSGTRITRIVEKPTAQGLGNYVLAGFFVLPTEIFGLLERGQGSMEQIFDRLVREPGLHASIWEDGWLDIEHPWDILAANRMIMDTWDEARISRHATVEGNVTLSGPVRIEPGSIIKAGAIISGPCYIGRDSYVGNNALIREYSSLGAGSTVGYGVELKNCVLFGSSTVGRLSFVGDSVGGENVDIGSGTMTINERLERTPVTVDILGEPVDSGLVKLGAFLGDDVKIGGSNTIDPGTVISPGTIIPHRATVPSGR
ncbi:NTP transferase domain-containing protein [Candidatus Binatia bacterium]|nr:NTP transferase domain-containing protein [Candidatus Binatia bacterium]